jgi:superfamily I DNA/RNA helicase
MAKPMCLTPDQQAVVEHAGNFLLIACPGSGKTRTGAHRIVRLSREGRRVAACSYTNVGANRLQRMLDRDLHVVLGPRSHSSTFHRFLQRFVLYPFGHLLGATQGPHVRVGGRWPDIAIGKNTKRIGIEKFHFAADGSLGIRQLPYYISESPAQVLAMVGDQVKTRKEGFFRAGVVSGDDAMWFALRILREFPELAAAVAGRFDELLLDEAQDTSELQLACLRELHKTGRLRSLVLIGDLEQSIYSFHGGGGERCRELAEQCGLATVELSENHRSSQKLCDVAVHFCLREQPDKAVGPYADCQIDPELTFYPPDDPQQAMASFRARLQEHGIEPAEAAVLTRRWKIAHAVAGIEPPVTVEERPLMLGRLVAAREEGTLTPSHLRSARALLAYLAGDKHLDELSDIQRDAVRRESYRLLAELPPLEGDLKAWMKRAREAVSVCLGRLSEAPAHKPGSAIRAGKGHEDHLALDVFSPPPSDISPQTVHAIKGEEREALMMVVHRASARDPTQQLAMLEATAAEEELSNDEEQRVTFVAITRAQRYCLLALPDDERGHKVATAFAGLGFHQV